MRLYFAATTILYYNNKSALNANLLAWSVMYNMYGRGGESAIHLDIFAAIASA